MSWLALGCLFLGACADVAHDGSSSYQVRAQDTLYSIAWRHDLDYRDLARWNHLGADLHISVGQILSLRSDGSAAAPGAAPPVSWIWPAEPHGAARAAAGGLLVPGQLGQEVRAASAGRVVYIGNGLRSYGNLIIVQHAGSVLSAYAHNREVLVHEGEAVAAGQVIAHMGAVGGQSPSLYFEVRQNGKKIDPQSVLPR